MHLMLFWLMLGAVWRALPTPPAKNTAPIPKRVAKWLVLAPPQSGSDAWYAANYSQYTWLLSYKEGQVIAVASSSSGFTHAKLPFRLTDNNLKDKEMRFGDTYAVKVENGWLIGRNRGEWGGDLWWYSPDGRKRYKISNEQIVGFFKTPGGLFACEGLAHLSLDFGHILRFDKDGHNRWKSERFVDLKHAPQIAAVAKDGSLLVATTCTLLRVKLNKQVESIVTNAFWGGLYPASIVETPSGDIYLGMRHGVARISAAKQKANTVDWLLPNQAFVHAKADLP